MSTSYPNKPEIAITGNFWMGHGLVSIWSMVRDCFSLANNEIQIATYSLGENPEDFSKLLEDTLSRGIRFLIIINRFKSQPVDAQKALITLVEKHSNFILRDFNPLDRREDLHAKLIVIDHSIALVGSANLTWKGMVANHELIVQLSGSVAYTIGELIDRLSRNSVTTIVRGQMEDG